MVSYVVAAISTATNGNKLAVAWLIKGFTDKKGRITDNQIAVMFGDSAAGTFDKPVLFTPAPNIPDKNPIAGPALSFTPDGKELAVSWVIEGGAIGFMTVDSTGKTVIAPRLVPGSYEAKDLASSMVSDGTYYSMAWSDSKTVTLGILDRKGNMATPPLSMGSGQRPSITAGFVAKEYSLFYWQSSAASSSKTLVYQQASCFPPPPKKGKKPKKSASK
jgi:hypothetical protein